MNPLSGAKSVTFLPSPSPLFCLCFYFRTTDHAWKCSLIRISSGSKLGPHVYAFTISKFNIYHKNPLLSQALALYTTKQEKQAANSFISFNTLASPGGGTGSNDVSLANETFKGTVAGGGYRCWVWCLATML